MTKRIESRANPHFRNLLGLLTSKGLKESKTCLLSGGKLTAEFLREQPENLVCEILHPGLTPITGGQVLSLAESLFDELDVLGTGESILEIQQPAVHAFDFSESVQGHEVIVATGDPGNLGALIRSCEAFRVSKVILTQEAAHPFLPKTIKASAGSVLRMPLFKTRGLSQLPNEIMALGLNGVSIENFKWPIAGRLLVGEEGPGLGNRKFLSEIQIPTQSVESLNAVVAASVALWEWSKNS